MSLFLNYAIFAITGALPALQAPDCLVHHSIAAFCEMAGRRILQTSQQGLRRARMRLCAQGASWAT